MSGGGKKGGNDDNNIPQIDPHKLIQEAIAANRVNVNTPFGSQTYGANGLTTTLSPEMQAILGQQLARAGGPANQYQLPGQNADILNGLNTRLNQRYGIALPPPAQGSSTGAGGGSAPGGTTSTPPSNTPPLQNGGPGSSPPQQPLPMPGTDNQAPNEWPSADPDFLPRGQAAAGAHYGQEYIGNMCVTMDSLLPGGVLAGDVQIGEEYPVHLPEQGFHRHRIEGKGEPALQQCVELEVNGGARLRCSRSTPFTFTDAEHDLQEGHWAYAPEMLGRQVWVLTPDGHESRRVLRVTELGEQWVIPLSFGGRSFAAGDDPRALIYSHNIVKDNYANVIGNVYGFGDTGMSGSNPLTGSVAQGQAGLSFYNPPAAADMPYMDATHEATGHGTTDTHHVAPTSTAPSPVTTGGFGLPYPAPIQSMPPLQAPPAQTHNNLLDNRYFKLATALLGGPGAALMLGGVNKFRHRNDDKETQP